MNWFQGTVRNRPQKGMHEISCLLQILQSYVLLTAHNMFQFRRAENHETQKAALPRRKPTVHKNIGGFQRELGGGKKGGTKLSRKKRKRKKPLVLLKKKKHKRTEQTSLSSGKQNQTKLNTPKQTEKQTKPNKANIRIKFSYF